MDRMTFGKKNIWSTVFYIGIILYVINLICIFTSGNCMFVVTSKVFNYISVILDAVFLIIFFNFLKRGSLTARYLLIMFCVLVLLPMVIALIFGGIRF